MKSNKSKRRQREFISSRLEKYGLGIIAFVFILVHVCVKTHNEFFFNAIPFENSFYFIYYRRARYRIQILCRRHPFGLTIADPPG